MEDRSMIEAEKRTYEHILVEAAGPIARITMNRPDKRNALSLAHMQELTECFKAIGEVREVQVVVLAGNGPAFCAGHDLSEMIGRDPETYRHIFDACCELMETVQSIPQPVIEQVHATATAAGCQLVATCDLVVASEEALAEGLVNRAVPAEELEAQTRKLAEKICEASPLVVGVGKQAFYRQVEMPVEQAYAYTKEVMSFNASFADAQEGMCAFLEKRKPERKGR